MTTAGSSVSGVIDPAGGRLASSDGGTSTSLLPDLHANLAAALDVATLAVVGASRYDAYGVTLATAAGTSAAGAWGYQGRLDLSPDPAAPLYDFGARPYAPGLGVFTSLDTYPGTPADPLSMNRYLYAAANPATFIDPTGHRYEEGWNPDIHGGSPAPGAPSGGVPEGVDVGPVAITDPTAPWVDDHTADSYDDLPDASREWLIERHGGDALALMSTPGFNGWYYPYLYALAYDYIARYDIRHAPFRWQTQLNAPLASLTVEEMDAARDASYDGNERFWISWTSVALGGGYAEGAAQLAGFNVAGVQSVRGSALLRSAPRPNSLLRGWSTGDEIHVMTNAGNTPAWSTVRARFWKNEAANPQYGTWSQANLDRMRRGLAPQRYNPDKGGLESMDLSHEPVPFRDGGTQVVPRWPQDHAAIDPYRRPGY